MTIFEAIKRADLDIFKDLLDQGSDLEQRDEKGYPLIYHTVSKGKEAKTRMLLKRGAELNVDLPEGSMVGAAVLGNMRWVLKELVKIYRADLNVPDQYGNTPIMYTLDPRDMKLLLDHGADISTRNKRGENILHRLARIDALEIMGWAIQAGVDVNAEADLAGSPLLIAARSGQSATMALLLEAGANPDIRDRDGRSLQDIVRIRLEHAHENSVEEDDMRKALLILLNAKPQTSRRRPPRRRIVRQQGDRF